MLRIAVAATLLFASALGGAQKPLDLPTELLKAARWRSLGPCNMGGRIADIAVDEKAPYNFFVATATGGLLKTTNNGTTWTSVFDSQAVASAGAVAVAPTDAKIVWVGTGEANGRNSSSWGDGVYKSTDGGQSWTNMGLRDTLEIGRIVIDPKNADVVLVAAAGHLWGANKERGVFRTEDGGKTWKHVLIVDDKTGAIDLAMGAPGSGVVFAATYERRRYPWGFEGEGPGSGIWKSVDWGKSWKRLANGLPEGPLGRIGLSVCRSKPQTVYAVIEASRGGSRNLFEGQSKYGGIFRSDDAGETWKRVNGTVPRGFYFGQIRVDPTNADRIYVLGFDLSVSDDGGKTFRSSSPGVHSDLHALWIDPARPEHLLLGTDGGIYTSYDRAATWSMIDNFPLGEFYEVAVDDRRPFWVYGGLQDNGSWGGPSAKHSGSGPGNEDWVFLEGGDGFYVVPDPADPNVVYAESQGGEVERIDRRTGKRRSLAASVPEGLPGLRFNWNSPVVVSKFDHDVVYVGGSRVIRFTKQGSEFDAASPDLSKQHGAHITATGSGAETYGTVVALAESPVTKGILWAGTDDGNVQVTQDGGMSWTDVTGSLPGKVREYYAGRIEASRFGAGTAYAAIDGHRSDDMAPYLFATDDFGKSWRSIVGDLPKHGPVKAIREDTTNRDLLFCGTEFGAFASFDRGQHWHKLGNGLPTVAVDDLRIQPRDHALVAATHGRSLYVMDNITPLEELTSANHSVHLFAVVPAHEFIPSGGDWFGGQSRFHAANPPQGAEIVYWLGALADEAPKVVITDAQNKTVAELSGERYPGLGRVRWDLQARPSQPGGRPRFAKPGTYTVTLTVGKEKRTQKLEVTGLPELSEPAPGEEP